MLAWKDEYSVDVAALDDQHKELFKLLNDLNEALEQEESVDIDYALTQMHVYMLFHFTSEEHLLAKYGYPDLEQHVEEHRKFKTKVEDFQQQCLENRQKLAEQVRDYLMEWIGSHVLETDKEYSTFLSLKVKR